MPVVGCMCGGPPRCRAHAHSCDAAAGGRHVAVSQRKAVAALPWLISSSSTSGTSCKSFPYGLAAEPPAFEVGKSDHHIRLSAPVCAGAHPGPRLCGRGKGPSCAAAHGLYTLSWKNRERPITRISGWAMKIAAFIVMIHTASRANSRMKPGFRVCTRKNFSFG